MSTKLNIQYLRKYPSKKTQGEFTNVYVVTGNDIDAFEDAQGSYLVIDADIDKHLWFYNKFIGNQGKIVIHEGKIFPDMDWLSKIKSTAKLLFGSDANMQMLYIAQESDKHMNSGLPYKVAKSTETEAVAETEELDVDIDDLA
jgi:hypothetical protein